MKASLFFTSFLSLSLCGASAQAPVLSIQDFSPTQLKIAWPSEPGFGYQLDSTPTAETFALCSPLGEPITATDSSTEVFLDKPSISATLYRLRILPDDGFPVARIVSPTAWQTVSGVFTVSVGAADDRRLSGVTLYLNALPIETKTEGDLVFHINSAQWLNGLYWLWVIAGDNHGISYLGGDPNANEVVNETWAGPVPVFFENSLRWLNADFLFESSVPISAESDIFPTPYTVFVEDEAGQTVRLFTGETADGIIETAWDGLDAAGQPVPEEQAYSIWIALGDYSSGAAAAMQTSAMESTAGPVRGSWQANRYGAFDFEVETAAGPSLLPPLPPGAGAKLTAAHKELAERLKQKGHQHKKQKISVRQFLLEARSQAVPALPGPDGGGVALAAPGGQPGQMVVNVVFKEKSVLANMA